MSHDDDNSFRVRPGRVRARDGKTARRPQSFMQEVKRAVAKQGGDPRRLFQQARQNRSGSGGEGREGGKLGDEKYLIIDGIDGRAHYVQVTDPGQLDEIRRGGIVEVSPPQTEPCAVDRYITAVAHDNFGV